MKKIDLKEETIIKNGDYEVVVTHVNKEVTTYDEKGNSVVKRNQEILAQVEKNPETGQMECNGSDETAIKFAQAFNNLLLEGYVVERGEVLRLGNIKGVYYGVHHWLSEEDLRINKLSYIVALKAFK